MGSSSADEAREYGDEDIGRILSDKREIEAHGYGDEDIGRKLSDEREIDNSMCVLSSPRFFAQDLCTRCIEKQQNL